MKSRKTIYILAFLLFLISGIQAQDIVLLSGKKSKTFKAGTFVQIVQPAPGTVPCEKCSHNIVGGKLISYQNGVVTMTVHEKKEVLVSDGNTLGFRETSYAKNTPLANTEIPRSDILAITPSGKNKLRTSSTGSTIAAVIGGVGISHLISTPLAGENAGLMAIVGASELVVAIILGVSSTPKTYVTHIDCPDKPKNAGAIWNWE